MTTFGFNLEDAKRIGRAVRLVERAEPRQDLAGEPNGAVSRGVRLLLAKHAGSSWPQLSSAIVTVHNGLPGTVASAVTLVAYNQYIKFSTGTNCTNRWISLGHNGFNWHPVDSMSDCGNCLSELGGVDFKVIDSYSHSQKQVLGHDTSGCLKWYSITTCSTAA